jgi:hypothetical protein
MNLKRDFLLVLASIIAFWLWSPINEGQLALTVLTGTPGFLGFGDWRTTFASSLVGGILGNWIANETHIFEKLKRWAKTKRNEVN